MNKRTLSIIFTIGGALLTAAGTILGKLDAVERTDEEIVNQVDERLNLITKKEDENE